MDETRSVVSKHPERSRREPRTSRRRGGGLLDLLVILALSLALVFGVVRPFIVEPFYVPSGSMEPTLIPGDRVLAAKFSYRFGAEPHKEDLVVIENPENPQEVLIKRVVGSSGDTVEVRDGVLFINGKPKKEPYVDYELTDSTFFGPEQVPGGHVFVMGDNRSNSRDSRYFGPVSEKHLLGKVILRFWPPQRAGLL